MSYIDLYMKGARNPFVSDSATTTTTAADNKAAVYMLGVPFDSTTSYRPGTRFGPDAIREALANIEYSSLLHDGVTLEDLQITDVGNLKSTTSPDAMVDMLSKVMGELSNREGLIAVLGGEHLLTLATYRGIMGSRAGSAIGDAMDEKDTMLVVFDAHFDLRDEFNDCRLNHATYLRRIIDDECNGDGSSVFHIGARGYSREELDYARGSRMNVLPAKDILLASGIDSDIRKRIIDAASTHDHLYISIDLDAIDPAFAPGVGTPEPFGLHPLHVLEILASLVESGKRIKCLDVVELCPPCDNGITSVLAAKLILEMILMYKDTR